MNMLESKPEPMDIFDLLGDTLGCRADEVWFRIQPNWRCLLTNGPIVEALSPAPSPCHEEDSEHSADVERTLLNHGQDFWPVLEEGNDYLIRQLPHDRILILTQMYQWAPSAEPRAFDAAWLGHGKLDGDGGREIQYLIQPKPEKAATPQQFADFCRKLESVGHHLLEPRPEHLGVYRGEIKLTMPWIAVKPRPISEVLQEVTDEVLREAHDFYSLVTTLQSYPVRALRLVMRIGTALVLQLENGNFLNLTDSMRLIDRMGDRPFDAPMLERGCWETPKCRRVTYFVHPPIQSPVTEEQADEFRKKLNADGYQASFVHREQLGQYQNQIVLLDPWEVTKRN